MADIEDGTQFSDLPSSLVIDILLRLPIKTLLNCRYVRKDWTRLYFSDPYFIRRQLAASNIQILYRNLIKERKLRFGCIVDEVSTENLKLETLELSCKLVHHPKYEWRVVNSCNGLLLLIDKPERPYCTYPCSTVYVCNPILGEWVSIPFPNRKDFYASGCALGFSGKNNQYKILSHSMFSGKECEWQIYTLGTGHWRSIDTKGNIEAWELGKHFNTVIHGSLHGTSYSKTDGARVVQAFNFATERFTLFSLPKTESSYTHPYDVYSRYCALGVINGCLWASFYIDDGHGTSDGEMWAMKEYGNDKSWSMMVALRNHYEEYDTPDEVLRAKYKELVIYEDGICYHQLLFSLNGKLMLTFRSGVICYNIMTGNRCRVLWERQDIFGFNTNISSVAYNPSFVSLHDVGREEEVIRL